MLPQHWAQDPRRLVTAKAKQVQEQVMLMTMTSSLIVTMMKSRTLRQLHHSQQESQCQQWNLSEGTEVQILEMRWPMQWMPLTLHCDVQCRWWPT
jgi:hypothetical protein